MFSNLVIASFSANEKELVARNEDRKNQGNEIGSPVTSDSWQGCDSSDSDGGALV